MGKNLHGSKRKGKLSSGKRAKRAARHENGNGPTRKRPIANQAGMNFLRHQDEHRWPSEKTMDLAHELSTEKIKRGRPKAPLARLGFPLMEQALATSTKAVQTLLVASSLKIKNVRRHPGWVLQRTYNLKNRPIVIV
jgi:hypothetical protein